MSFLKPWHVFVAVSLLSRLVGAGDLSIYSDGNLASGWENWSWGSTIGFAATDIFEGSSSISITSDAWSALSVKLEGTFPNFAGLKFDIAGDQPDISIFVQSTADNSQSPTIPLSAIKQGITQDKFESLLINFNDLPGSGAQLGNGTWDRITFQAGGNGATYHLDNIVLVSSIFVQPTFLSAEPLGSNVIAVTTIGNVDFSQLHVSINNTPIGIGSMNTYVPVDTPSKSITYLHLKSNLSAGSLKITTNNATFTHTLPAVQYASIVQSVNYPINPHIYGVNFPTSPSYIQHLGIPISRWGGNAVTAYNPFGGFTNAGFDWFFENRNSDSADDWMGWVSGAGSDTLLTVPALDWVSKDATSYSYPRTKFPDQQKYDPFNSDAGNGLFSNGSSISPAPNQNGVYVPWNVTAVKQWLSGLKHKPTIVTIDNEIEIASSTHQDMHPNPVGYDEELSRVIKFGTAVKEALPNALIAAPSTCSWWFYWTSVIGWNDNAAHFNIDFLPWFLAQMKQHHDQTGKRLLDYLDIHYYFQADTSANDDAAKALRLRQTRSLWDTSYVDESWIGVSPQNHQWSPDIVSLIPRFRTLIDINYPGTKLSVSEWSSTNDGDITGGLVTADALGIFGRYKLDSATYWATPSETGPVGLAYWLYRGYGTYFGASSAQVNMATPNPNVTGLYAGTDGGNKLSLVVVNKDPAHVLAFDLANVPTGLYFLRHFGGAAGVAKWQTNITITTSQYIVVPPYTAVFLKQV
ncbi:glycoside hydrolase family 44 protein [Amanita thiersii Skay4041]|uniref:Glycoside hydrolase family 44 protein n=1 Tax=Amanita thiersii Skay4041 TaxID=703135 RepID=A0A2A9NAS3_9AGAR|nr:glycoside hydrolase family 44 protein [Amanita thiersii Skay4041]